MNNREKISESIKYHEIFNFIFGTEIWSLAYIFLTQDFPFLITRVLILASFKLEKNYMIYFLAIKNFLLCILEIYRIAVLFIEEKRKHEKKKRTKLVQLAFNKIIPKIKQSKLSRKDIKVEPIEILNLENEKVESVNSEKLKDENNQSIKYED